MEDIRLKLKSEFKNIDGLKNMLEKAEKALMQ